jgi:hypothetical protein
VAKKDKSKGKLPKTIGGIKVPKALRKSLASSLLDSPKAREILADVIMAAAGAAAAALVRNRASGQQVTAAGEAAIDAGAGAASVTGEVAQSAAGAVTDVVADAARHILPTSLTAAGDDDDNEGKDYAHLPSEHRKAKKDKNRSKASKH